VLQHGDGELHVAVTIDTHGLGSGRRVPTDFVVVFDRSGSMGGQKIEYGKQALRELLGRLSDEDRFGLVAYDSTAEVRVPLADSARASRARWLSAVDELAVAGGTNLSAGLELGLSELSRGHTGGRASRMLLLSDGLANEGDSSLSGLVGRARRVTRLDSVLSAIGVGADFDENLMTSLARAGTGAFYYLAKLETLPVLMNAELKTASETYAERAELRLKLEPGVKLVSAAGVSFSQEGDTVVIPLGSLYADYTQKTWLTLRAPSAELRETAVGELSVRYRHDGQAFEVTAAALPKVACVSDAAEFKKRIVEPVWERAMLEEELGRSKEAMSAAIRQGNAKDVDDVVAAAESQQALAESLGNQRVIGQIAALRAEAPSAKAAQVAGSSARSVAAKRAIADSYDLRSKSSFKNVDPSISR
jgi:Ca-activated chloride channel family protein